MIELPSSNWNLRPEGEKISVLVLHYTGMLSCEDAIARMCSAEGGVSAHYVVDEDGTQYRLVAEENRAWHCGISCWNGRAALNDISIGIEVVNPGHEFGYRPFPRKQMESVRDLARDIIKRHAIIPRNVVGHADIATRRKKDPGELFDWQWLASEGVGVWPKVKPLLSPRKVLLSLEDRNDKVYQLQHRLARYGYHIREDGYYGEKTEHVVIAFKRHFVQDQVDGVWTAKAEAMLEGLLKV